VKSPKTAQKQGIGLYTYEQEKYTTPFQYFVHIVVGGFIASLGIIFGIIQYQSAPQSMWSLAPFAMAILVGAFMAHAGVIFWYRRLRKNRN
jgi:formate/nitrite transporter FocA (FNT family)